MTSAEINKLGFFMRCLIWQIFKGMPSANSHPKEVYNPLSGDNNQR